jgi:lysophospholipase L1-like esterase
MDVVTLGAAKADAKRKYASLTRSPLFQGIQVTDVTYQSIHNGIGTNASAGTSRTPFLVATDCFDVRLVFVGWYSNGSSVFPYYTDVDYPAAVPIKASIKYPVNNVIYPVTFRGALTGTIDPGGMLVSDPLPVDFLAGSTFDVLVYTSATNWRATRTSSWSTGGGGFTATTDLTVPGSAAVPDSQGLLLAPALITATPYNRQARSVVGLGDSIISGVGDSAVSQYNGYISTVPWRGGGGFINRALRGIVGYSSASLIGEQAQHFNTFGNSFRRRMFLSQFTDGICEYGRNDVSNGRTLAQIQADLLSIWTTGVRRGLRMWQTTITPYTTTTDGWGTTAGQTALAGGNESVRVQLNTWIRAGAPMSGGAAVAVGTSGALTAGQTGHPLAGYFEIADTVESARNSGLWKAADKSFSDGAITTGTNTLTSATAAFTSADLNKPIAIQGASTAGSWLYALITAVNSSTSVSVSVNASTTASGAKVSIGAMTADGIHPNQTGATLMAAGIDTARILAV